MVQEKKMSRGISVLCYLFLSVAGMTVIFSANVLFVKFKHIFFRSLWERF